MQTDGGVWESNGVSGFFADIGSDILIMTDGLGKFNKWIYCTGAFLGWTGTVLSNCLIC